MLKLKLQYFGHLMQRADSLEKTVMLGKVEGRRRGRQRMRRLDGITDSMDVKLSKLRKPGVLQVAKTQTVVSDCRTATKVLASVPCFPLRFHSWTSAMLI